MHEVNKLERSNSYLISCERSGEGDPPGSLPLAGRPHEDDLSFCRMDIARSVTPDSNETKRCGRPIGMTQRVPWPANR